MFKLIRIIDSHSRNLNIKKIPHIKFYPSVVSSGETAVCWTSVNLNLATFKSKSLTQCIPGDPDVWLGDRNLRESTKYSLNPDTGPLKSYIFALGFDFADREMYHTDRYQHAIERFHFTTNVTGNVYKPDEEVVFEGTSSQVTTTGEEKVIFRQQQNDAIAFIVHEYTTAAHSEYSSGGTTVAY